MWITIAFIIGVVLGVFIGIVAMAILSINESDHDDYEFGKLVDRSLDDKDINEPVIGKAEIGKEKK